MPINHSWFNKALAGVILSACSSKLAAAAASGGEGWRWWNIAAFTALCHLPAQWVRMALHQHMLFLFTALCTLVALSRPRGPWTGTVPLGEWQPAPQSQHVHPTDMKNSQSSRRLHFLYAHCPLLSCSCTRLTVEPQSAFYLLYVFEHNGVVSWRNAGRDGWHTFSLYSFPNKYKYKLWSVTKSCLYQLVWKSEWNKIDKLN